MHNKYPLIFIVGPTAAGKTDVAVSLAEKISADIVSCDSMLVYREPRLLVNKPDRSVLDKTRHHLIDIVSVEEEFDVHRFKQEADAVISRLYPLKNLIFAGGSGLYIKILLDGIFEGGASSSELRQRLSEQAKAEGVQSLHDRLRRLDPDAAATIDPHDLRRIIRALEVGHLSDKPISVRQKEAQGYWGALPIKVFGLALERKTLYQRIDARTEEMFSRGAIEEAKELTRLALSKTAEKILGLPEISAYLCGTTDRATALDELKKNTRRFAKRQLTWFRKDKRIEWIDSGGKNPDAIAEEILCKL
ncbi:tRNA (adenosine(37)-N6)-dimethylallyltransferase MiaA [Candidatus Omnitrophota bacterium]